MASLILFFLEGGQILLFYRIRLAEQQIDERIFQIPPAPVFASPPLTFPVILAWFKGGLAVLCCFPVPGAYILTDITAKNPTG